MDSVQWDAPGGVKCPSCGNDTFDDITEPIAAEGAPFREAICSECKTRFKIIMEEES